MGNTPKLRFDGFTGSWEQHKLSEIAEKVTEKNSDLAIQETFTNSAEFGVISQRDFFDHDISNADNIDGYYVVRDDDFVYNPRISVTAPVGPVNRNKLGRDGVMSPLYTVFRTHDIDTTYLEWFFKSSYWHSFMFFNGDSGARSDRFSIKNAVFFEMPIPVPCEKEQHRVGAYLDKLNYLIALLQRQYKALEGAKQFYIQNMFPQKGERKPRIRFSGFSGDWKRSKCQDIMDRVGIPAEVKEGEFYREIGIRSHGKGLFHKDEVSSKDIGNKRVFWVESDCFVLNIVFAWERAVAKTTEDEIGMIASHRFPMYKPRAGIADLDYITLFFTTDMGKDILELASPGGAGRNKTLGQAEFANSKIWLPSYDEQVKIGEFFVGFEKTISLYRRKVAALKLLKQFMLQNLFPEEV